eukprot:jgi/Picre1/32402/NNA_007748.t1
MSWVKANRILNSHDKAIAVNKEISGSFSSAQQNGRVMMVSMYDEAPDGDISLEEFERFAVDRLHVLRGIEDLKARNYKGDELSDRIVKLAQVHLKDATKESTMRKDVASHYVLRLAFCQTEDKRKWFLIKSVSCSGLVLKICCHQIRGHSLSSMACLSRWSRRNLKTCKSV